MGKSAKIEILRRVLPLFLGILAITGWFAFLSSVSALLVLAAAVGIYAAMPEANLPVGAVRPQPRPGIIATDLIGFAIGVPLFSLALAGMSQSAGVAALLFALLAVPAGFSLLIFMISVRHQTSWVRFFGNGFEFSQLGLRIRVPYTELAGVRVAVWQASGLAAWFQSTFGSIRQKTAVMLNGAETTKTLVFTRKDGSVFTISSELIPDLQRILIGMDRAGVDLPEGIGQRQRVQIRKRREKLYGADPKPEADKEQLDVARIAALIEHARRAAN